VDDVVMDLEASCREAAWVRSRMETIVIGAVRLGADLEVVEEDDALVRPVAFPRLSSFCTELTSITQDHADTFPKAFARFLNWMGPSARLTTWDAFDIGQLRLDCHRHDMVFPEHLAAPTSTSRRRSGSGGAEAGRRAGRARPAGPPPRRPCPPGHRRRPQPGPHRPGRRPPHRPPA
jgi:hypothetical protein